uniref:Uncharacterized protein n=1 Tax=Rhizophora mucronata TaxID=61149 RepID=A0A2P2K8A1_RHIMU
MAKFVLYYSLLLIIATFHIFLVICLYQIYEIFSWQVSM